MTTKLLAFDDAAEPPLKTLAQPGALGPVGDATHSAQVTTDANGRVTALTSVPIASSVLPPALIIYLAQQFR